MIPTIENGDSKLWNAINLHVWLSIVGCRTSSSKASSLFFLKQMISSGKENFYAVLLAQL
jgi:hypothetical protein|uniref:Uncharacterized protein n=1 Tax=Populus trichocarpa TaxID=3694 RepID=A0A2K1YMQ0_POPTR